MDDFDPWSKPPSHDDIDTRCPPRAIELRDYFAAAALQGLLAGRDDDRVVSEERIAKSAYAAADAMIAARKETP